MRKIDTSKLEIISKTLLDGGKYSYKYEDWRGRIYTIQLSANILCKVVTHNTITALSKAEKDSIFHTYTLIPSRVGLFDELLKAIEKKERTGCIT